MESTIVIKVKYGETLRRFNALVVNKELALGIGGLHEKVLNLFDFAPDADLKLTYVDEDGDIVTLVDEEDLRDVVRQSLDPLRITVSLNSEKSARSYIRSSGSSTPMRLPYVQNPFQNLNSGVSEMLKSVPEPFRDTLSKLSVDLASKATSSAPNFTELVECLSKMGLYYLNQGSENLPGAESSSLSGVCGDPHGASVAKGFKSLKVDGLAQDVNNEVLTSSKVDGCAREVNNEVLVSSKVDGPVQEANNEVLLSSKSKEQTSKGIELIARSADASFGKTAVWDASAGNVPAVKFDTGLIENALNDSISKFSAAVSNTKVEMPRTGHLQGKSSDIIIPNLKIVSNEEDKNGIQKNECDAEDKSLGAGAGTGSSSSSSLDKRGTPNFQTSRNANADSANSSWSRACFGPIRECSFTGTSLENDSGLPAQNVPSIAPFKRSYNYSEGMGSIFHRGVRCDGCGVYPITGPRFKSKVKEDYDLCSICFAEMGNVADYIRMDRPATYRRPLSVKGMYNPMQHSMHPATLPRVLRGIGMKPRRPKLDSRFIQDVNILDGTIMAPFTPFTKIWRMKNNGTITWPQGTQLVWIGGDKLNDILSVEVEIPADGLAVDSELDIVVDFTAPELPGRYISYWRMAAPSGQKFGQRVWVLIQVDTSFKDLMYENVNGLNLNLPPTSTGVAGPEIINVNVEQPMMDDGLREPDNFTNAIELVATVLEDDEPEEAQKLNFPINDDLLIWGVAEPTPAVPSSSVSYLTNDFSGAAPTVAASATVDSEAAPPVAAVASPAVDLQVTPSEAGIRNDVEQTLLKELDEMGFKQVDVNKKILRMNEYDLEQAVRDLCGVSEWDPILEELQEMGFHDKEMNLELLKKNNGSIKRVVMDLITGENASN